MPPLHVEVEGTAKATPEVVWGLIIDPRTYAQWGPWDDGGYGDGTGSAAEEVGPLRWFRSGRTTTVERTVEVEAPSRLVYVVVDGIPVRNYRAEVTLTAVEAGTHIRWVADWDATLRGRAVHRVLAKFYPTMLTQLIAHAEQNGPTTPA